MKASGTTYNVPSIKRGKSRAKISHIAKPCRTKHDVQKIQNSQEVRFLRPNIRRPNNAQKVHMTAACHLCGGLPLSRTIIATNPSPMPTQPKTSSLTSLSFSPLGISDTSGKRSTLNKPFLPCPPTFRMWQHPWRHASLRDLDSFTPQELSNRSLRAAKAYGPKSQKPGDEGDNGINVK